MSNSDWVEAEENMAEEFSKAKNETDKELLELAANAAGIAPFCWCEPVYAYEDGPMLENGGIWDYTDNRNLWNPLTDDGDALRLAVKLKISIEFWEEFGEVWTTNPETKLDSFIEPYGEDPYAATRRAIVRAAAEIGRTME